MAKAFTFNVKANLKIKEVNKKWEKFSLRML